MKTIENGPDEKITNADEQEVVINQSTIESGFDDPASVRKPRADENAAEVRPKDEVKQSPTQNPEKRDRSES